jgi:hypothetical protein
MDKDSLLKQLADYGYRLGFGAKKHFATYDIVSKVPGGISIIGLLIGVGQLAYPHYKYSTGISTILIMASIMALTMSSYNAEKEIYNQIGQKITQLFNELEAIYYNVKDSSEQTFTTEVEQMKEILTKYYQISRSQQIFGSDWFAHYKFFWQMEKDWIEEQRPFKLWKDKIPKSLLFFLIIMALVAWSWYLIFVRGE